MSDKLVTIGISEADKERAAQEAAEKKKKAEKRSGWATFWLLLGIGVTGSLMAYLFIKAITQFFSGK